MADPDPRPGYLADPIIPAVRPVTTVHASPELLDAAAAHFMPALVRSMARRCGLEDPDAFAAKERLADRLGYVGDRGTGRTTRTLLQALCALEVGCSVELVCADQGQAVRLDDEIQRLASRAGIGRDDRHLNGLALTWPGRVIKGLPLDLTLVDHYAAERAAQRERVKATTYPVRGEGCY